ncbi:MAG: dienelactone hydrolase family protein [Myxococcales bacterium]|nr:dienelactone hydrolase family protein [Myxococcales bacterium]
MAARSSDSGLGLGLALLLCAAAACELGAREPAAAEPKPAPVQAPALAASAKAVSPGAEAQGARACSAPDAQGWGQCAGLRYLELLRGGAKADSALPMVVLIHGLGDRPRDVWIGEVGVPMRIILPQAPIPRGPGFSWFEFRVGDGDSAGLARGIATAAAQLARALEGLRAVRPTRGLPFVGGFSQGGMLSYALALGHPQVLSMAHPIAGMLPRPLWPREKPAGVRLPPIRAAHGDSDRIVPAAADRALHAHLKKLGYDAELREYPGVAHQISPEMGERLGAIVMTATSAAAAQ